MEDRYSPPVEEEDEDLEDDKVIEEEEDDSLPLIDLINDDTAVIHEVNSESSDFFGIETLAERQQKTSTN